MHRDREFPNHLKGQVAIIVPHPDDETAVHVKVLAHYPNLLMVHITDGGTDIPSQWKGLSSREEYAALRQQEVHAALDEARHNREKRVCLGVVDGRVAWHIKSVKLQLCDLFEEYGIQTVFTLAYEGGHPDHDATAFVVHWAARRYGAQVIESPMYHPQAPYIAVDDMARWEWQRFLPAPDVKVMPLALTQAERTLKERMRAAHRSQEGILRYFSGTHEFYRYAPEYNFSRPANNGVLSELYAWHQLNERNWPGQINAAL